MNARDREVLVEKAEARLRRLAPERRALEAAVFAVSESGDLQEFVEASTARTTSGSTSRVPSSATSK